MHTNRINSKNTKRFAIATSVTAAVLFLGAGLVASCGGKSNNTKAVSAPLAVVPAPIVDEVSEIVEAPLTAAPLAEASAPQKGSTQSKSPVKSPKTKKSPAVSGGAGAKQSAAAPNTSASPAPQQGNNTAVAAPAEQPAVNQQPAASDAVATAPADAQPAAAPADAQPATSQEAAPAQQPAAQEQPTATSSGSSVRVPLWTLNRTPQDQRMKTPSLPGSTVSIPCIPNYTC